jgi:prevent-host-death family protein
MIDITNSHSLTDFQRNAKGLINGLNESREPLLITVNGKVQAVLIDPNSYQEMEAKIEKEKFLSAVRVGLKDISEGRSRPVELVIAELSAKYDL